MLHGAVFSKGAPLAAGGKKSLYRLVNCILFLKISIFITSLRYIFYLIFIVQRLRAGGPPILPLP
jgi:hypothetical protein